MLSPGDRVPCAICATGEAVIADDANPDALALLNEEIERRGGVASLLCEECAVHVAGPSERRRITLWTGAPS